jgi:iron complex outermembrane receptor protein
MSRQSTIFKPTAVRLSVLIACAAGFGGGQASAQESETSLQRVEVTGSALKRIAGETALPVQVLSRKDIEKSGATNVTDLLQRLPAVQNATSEGSAVGGETFGFAGVSIHNIGETRTLVLLNGRRVAKSGGQSVTGGFNAVDLNTLPISAIERVEILTDGASALYGADAVAGVVNLITRKTSTDFSLSAGTSSPSAGGAAEQRVSLSKGFGDYNQDGFNLSFSLSMDKREALAATQRDFAKTGLISGNDGTNSYKISNSNGTSKRAVPANLNLYYIDAVDGFSQLDRLNPSVVSSGNCPPYHIQSGSSCRYDFTSQLEIYPERERTNAYVSFDKDLGQGLKWFSEVLWSSTKSTARIAPPPGELAIPQGTAAYAHALQIAAAGGYSPGTATDGTTFLADQLDANLRFTELGKRTNINEQTLTHLATGLEGSYQNWDYSTALVHSENLAKDTFGGGYARVSGVAGAVLRGFDPFLPLGAQNSAGAAAINSAKIDGYWNGGLNTLDMVSLQATREVGKLDGGPVQLAIGASVQRETLDARPGTVLGGRSTYRTDENGQPCSATLLPCVGTGIDQRFGDTGIQPAYTASRNTTGLFGELGLPLSKELELTTSARFDQTSDFGSTTNGKVAMRYQPSKSWLLRGSVGTGYIAPSISQVSAPKQNFGVTSQSYTCDSALNTLATSLGVMCDDGSQFNQYAKGNAALQPERTKQATLGVVWEANPSTSFSADFWTVQISDLIGQVTEQVAFADPARFAKYFTDFTDPSTGKKLLAYMAPNENLGNAVYTGIDFTASSRNALGEGKLTTSVLATLMLRSEQQQVKDGPYLSDLNNQDETGSIAFKWQGKIINTYDIGQWSHSLTINAKSGYTDSTATVTNVATGDDQDVRLEVKPYATLDWQTTYYPNKNVSISGGVLNFTDRKPPFVFSQGGLNRGQEVGWDGRYYDPRGATLYLNGTIKF